MHEDLQNLTSCQPTRTELISGNTDKPGDLLQTENLTGGTPHEGEFLRWVVGMLVARPLEPQWEEAAVERSKAGIVVLVVGIASLGQYIS